jgi:hypothetical protein
VEEPSNLDSLEYMAVEMSLAGVCGTVTQNVVHSRLDVLQVFAKLCHKASLLLFIPFHDHTTLVYSRVCKGRACVVRVPVNTR